MAKTLTGQAKTAWDAFSQWVKVKGCIETTSYPFVGVCITCEKRFHITFLESGHLISGRSNGVLFDEELVNPQCVICNQRLHGRHKKYRKVMVAKYGEAHIAKREREGKKPVHNREMDYPAITKKYRELTTKLLIPFGYSTYKEMLHGHQL
jgi:hypothetical protein